jgi:RND family efflux transporter MFP subunit
MVAFMLAGVCGLPFAPAFAEAMQAAHPDAPQATAVVIPEAMRPNLKIQSEPVGTTQNLPITQGMVSISAAASNQASSQVSAPADGLIVGNLPQIGQVVTAGQTLFELASAGLADLQGQWSMAQARAALAQQNLKRDAALFADGLIAQKRLDDTRSQAQSAGAELAAATARLKVAGITAGKEAAGGNLAVRAPVTGVVTQRKIMPGERVMAGQALAEITMSGAQWWLMAVPPKDAPAAGTEAELKIAGCPEAAPVKLVDLAVDPLSQMVMLRAEPKTACAQLRPGQKASASLWIMQPNPVQVVPIGAVTEFDNQPQVFVQRGAQFFLVPVQLRGELDGLAYVSGNFQSQDLVVTHGMSRLKALALGMGAE